MRVLLLDQLNVASSPHAVGGVHKIAGVRLFGWRASRTFTGERRDVGAVGRI